MSAAHPSHLPVNADECAREPIHIPGTIQPHGLLFVLETGSHRILQVSENTAALIGREPESLLGTDFLSLIPEEARPTVENLVRSAVTTYVNPFRVPVMVDGGLAYFDGIVHLPDDGDTVVELESTPVQPAGREATEGLENYLQIIHRTLAEISSSQDVGEIAAAMAREVKAFTGFDRVMVYRFAEDFHGQVIAEEKEPDMEPYMDLHFPASDIPAQARALYLRNHVRLLRSVDAQPAALVPAMHPRTGRTLDMSRAVLRTMSPIHLRYLKNMGVASSLSISLVVDGALWGLIACHHRTPRFVSYAVRATSSLYAIVMSAQLRAKMRAWESLNLSVARRNAFDIVTGLSDYSDPVGSLASSLPALTRLFEADGAAVLSTRGVRAAGSSPPDEVLLEFWKNLGGEGPDGIVISDHAAERFPTLSDTLPQAAGIVAIHLGEQAWLVLFRDEAVQKIRWAGDPDLEKSRDPGGQLQPRHSFAAWLETVRGRSMRWPDITRDLTTEVRAGILELVRKRNVLLERSNQDLHRFAGIVAHEVKNQLQAGIMVFSMLEDLPEKELSPDIRKLVGFASHSLSGLAKFTNDLLIFSEVEMSATVEDIDFAAMAHTVVEELKLSGRADGANIRILPLPNIRGPRTQMQHLLSNLLRNALIHARADSRELEIEIGSRQDSDLGTVVYVRDDGRGIPADQQDKIFDYLYTSREGPKRGTGIGLAYCAQVLQRLGHRLWVESEIQSGATFLFSVSPAESRT